MTSKFRRGSFRSSWELGAQNTHIYDENRIFSVFRRESSVEFVSLCQSRKAANPRNRKCLQNPSGITDFDVFEVGTKSKFIILDSSRSVFAIELFY